MEPICNRIAIVVWASLIAGGALLAAPYAAADIVPNQVGSYGVGVAVQPTGVAVAPNGNIYVVSQNTRRIEVFSRLGTQLFGWGSNGTGPGQFTAPSGIACAPDGTIYVVDAGSARVQRFTPAGAYVGEFGTPGAGNGQLAAPRGVAVDASGNVFVADTFNHRLEKFTYAGVYLGQWGGQGADEGRFQYPQGVGVDARGRVYVADTYNHRVQEFDNAGVFLRQWGTVTVSGNADGQFNFPSGVAVDASFNVFVADENNHRIQRFTNRGRFVSKWGSQGSGAEQFYFPQGLAVDAHGDVHVADTANNRVQVYRTRQAWGHEAILSWGSAGSGNGQFSDVRGVAVAPDGFVFVADKNGNRVQKFTGFGAWAAGWGSSGSGNGQFNGPTGVAVDASGVVYVTDFGNSRVQKFSSTGAYLGQWGSAGSGPGQFTGIWDIAVDASNNVWVVDAHRLQKFTTTGAFLDAWSTPNAAGVGVDAEGMVYVACTSDHVVRKFAPDGTPLAVWGSLGTNPGQFFNPTDVACDTSGYVYVCDANDRVQQFTALGGYVAEWGEPGSARDQIGAPQMMAVDPAGSVYVSEFLNYRVQKFASPPELISIVDVPADEGGYATVSFAPSSAEAPQSGAGAVNYRIVLFGQPIGVILAFFPADGVTHSAVVHLATSATETWPGLCELQVQTLTSVPGSAGPVSTNWGYATDELPPPVPAPLAGAYSAGATHLHWPRGPAGDLWYFQVHRGGSPDFSVGLGSYIAATNDTTWNDVGPAGRWYKVVAVDTSGNLGAPAVLGPDQTTDAPGAGGELAFALAPLAPNPATGASLTLHFVLPDAEPARIELISAAGRSVWAQPVHGAGAHAMRVGGEHAFAPGIYFVRLTRGTRSLVRRAVVLD